MVNLKIIIPIIVVVLGVTGLVIYFATKKSSSSSDSHKSGCGKDGKKCPDNYTCQDGVCVSTIGCSSNKDCTDGKVCINPGTEKSFCTVCSSNGDCPTGNVCVNDATRTSFCTTCGKSSDCVGKYIYLTRTKTPNFPSNNNSPNPTPNMSQFLAEKECDSQGASCSGFVINGANNDAYFKDKDWYPFGPPPSQTDLVDILAVKRIPQTCLNPDKSNSECVECQQDGDCMNGNVCDTETNFCYQCLKNKDCVENTGKTMCQDNVCVADPCLPNGVGVAEGSTVTCTCKNGFTGNHCQYSDAVTCNGHGTVNSTGVCTCSSGWKGDHCDVPTNTPVYQIQTVGCGGNEACGGQCKWTPGLWHAEMNIGCDEDCQPPYPQGSCCYCPGGGRINCNEVVPTNTNNDKCYDGHKLKSGCYLSESDARNAAQANSGTCD